MVQNPWIVIRKCTRNEACDTQAGNHPCSSKGETVTGHLSETRAVDIAQEMNENPQLAQYKHEAIRAEEQ